MIFNSLTFLVFLLTVYCLYWLLNRRKQNVLILIASNIFYGWWDWRFLSLLILSSGVDYLVGIWIAEAQKVGRRKLLLGVSLVTNLGLLGVFKYFNFFADSFVKVLDAVGMEASYTTLNIVLPVGISFYSFQTLSYTIDVYRGQCAVHRDPVEFFSFVAFFPQLVAGPIERAKNLLEQFARDRVFDLKLAKDGLRQMLWGFFQKVVIADGVSEYVNLAYGDVDGSGGGMMLLASYMFAFQIYCDFSGYSNIAVGCSRLFGFELMRNFAYPYFARSIAEFWQRWHISLSTWFRDYLYIPMGGNRGTLRKVVFNVMVTFTVSGLWHGANWTFVVWGALNGIYFLPSLIRRHLTGREKARIAKVPGLKDWWSILITFHLTVLAWIFFRSADMGQAFQIFGEIANDFDLQQFLRDAIKFKIFVLVLLTVEWIQRGKLHALEIEHLPTWLRWTIYNVVVMAIIMLGSFNYNPFIYFQF